MKCSQCGGNIICNQYLVYYTDGSSSGNYTCEQCGAKKEWFNKGIGEQIINMKED
jgi:hypothetical protein